jgi:hypothetical protein
MNAIERALREVEEGEYDGAYYHDTPSRIDGLIEISDVKRILRQTVAEAVKEEQERIAKDLERMFKKG